MDHVVIPLDQSHVHAVERLVAFAGARPSPGRRPHITVVAHEGLTAGAAQAVVDGLAADLAPFAVHAHGYGLFTGAGEGNRSLHVPVVRTDALNELHGRVVAAVEGAGGVVASWCDADRWSPHITVLDGVTDGSHLAAAVAALAERHHPSWEIHVTGLECWGAEDRRPSVSGPMALNGPSRRGDRDSQRDVDHPGRRAM